MSQLDSTRRGVYATFAALSILALLLGALLMRPGIVLKPDRNAPAFELDEPPAPPVGSPSSAPNQRAAN